MMKILLISLFCILIFSLPCFADTENLDELMARKTRHASMSGNHAKAYLENPTTYVWQPESVIYKDVTTNHEVVILIRAPSTEYAIYAKEYAVNAFSADGGTTGVWLPAADRTTNNTGSPGDSDLLYRRWLVKTNGAYLKCAEGGGHETYPEGGFGWAHTENAYYAFGSNNSPSLPDDEEIYQLVKNNVSTTNTVTHSMILDTDTATGGDDDKGFAGTKKQVIKMEVSGNDDRLSVSSRAQIDRGLTINCYGHMVINLNQGSSPTILNYWGVNRQCYEYGDHQRSNEYKAHGGGNFALGLNHEYNLITYTGSEHVWFLQETSGSDADGGPNWEDWDGDSYGLDEIIPLSSADDRSPTPDGTYHCYFNHPSFDAWGGKWMIEGIGHGTSCTYSSRAGTIVALVDIYNAAGAKATSGFDNSEGFVDDGIKAGGGDQYDGRHHFWGGWTDHAGFFPATVGASGNSYRIMYGAEIDWEDNPNPSATNYQIADVHNDDYGDATPYHSLPRPSQSPDGTKVAFAYDFLMNTDSDIGLAYAVAYYPHPPEITACTATGGTVTVTFEWMLDSTPRGYTTRGWPDESTDDPPPPRETEYFRLWKSTDKTSWTPLDTEDADIFTRYNFVDGTWSGSDSWTITETSVSNGTKYYYTVTSVEWSGLESHSVGNIFDITLTAGSGTGSEDTAYTSNPGDLDNISASDIQSSFVNADTNIIKGYNIYANDGSAPSVQPQDLIAFVPKEFCSGGNCHWTDFLGHADETTQYVVAAVDTQGNVSASNFVTNQSYTACESGDCSAVTPEPTEEGHYIIEWDDMYVAYSGGADTTAPTLSTASIPNAGTTMEFQFDESVSVGAGGNGGFATTPSGGAATLTYASGSGSSKLIYTLSRTIDIDETGTIAYTQPGNGIEDGSGNDLATISSEDFVNYSTQGVTENTKVSCDSSGPVSSLDSGGTVVTINN